VLFKPDVEPTVSEGVSEPCVVQPRPETLFEQSDARSGPRPVFLDKLDDPFINLDRVEDLEVGDNAGSYTPIEIVQIKPIQCPKPSEWGPKHRFKTFTSGTNLSLVRRPRTCHFGSSFSSS